MDDQAQLTTKQLKINDQLNMLANNYNLISYANIVVGGLTVYVLWGVVEKTVLVGWYAVVVLMMLGRHLIKNRFLSNAITTPSLLNKWQTRFISMSLVAGIWWGIGAWLFITPQYPQLVTFIAVSWIGMVAGTIGSQGVHLPSFIAYCLPTMLALSTRIITIGGESYVILGFFALSLTMGFLGFARANYKTVVESLNLRYQKDELVNELATKNDDLSEQMAKVELANKQKSQFLAAASHDLRQPLQSLQLFIEILRTQLNTSQSQETLSRVEGSTMALQELLNALLDISRLEAGDVNKHVKNIPLQPMLQELVTSNQTLAANNNIVLSLINTSACVATDGVLLHRCLNNLIVNAIAHSGGCKVTIGVRRRKNHIDILVIDNGVGISESDQEEIFLEFHQLQNPERDRRKGLGLGLAIVKRTCDILSHPLVLKSQPQRGS
ncbi:MAG: sensor histidine kinase, partial [Psychrobium sp.]